MKKVIVAVSALFLTNTALAGNFEGFSVFAKAGSQSVDNELKWIGTNGDVSKSDGNGRSSLATIVGADYGFKVNDKFLTLVGVEFKINNSDVYKSNEYDSSTGDTSKTKYEQKNAYSIYLAPGYLINEETLIYAKLSYNKTKIEGKFTDYDASASETTNTKYSRNFDGFGYGIGARVSLNKNLFLNAEWQKIQFDNESKTFGNGVIKAKPDATIGTIGIGYNF